MMPPKDRSIINSFKKKSLILQNVQLVDDVKCRRNLHVFHGEVSVTGSVNANEVQLRKFLF